MPVPPATNGHLFDSVAELLDAAGFPVLTRHYPMTVDGAGTAGQASLELEREDGPYICTHITEDSANDAGSDGDTISIEADGRLITVPSDADYAALVGGGNALTSVGGEGMWPAPFYAQGRITARVRTPVSAGNPNADALLFAGIHTSPEGAEHIRRCFGELRAATLTLDSTSAAQSRDVVDFTEAMIVKRLVRTGDTGTLISDLRVRLGSHEVISRQGDPVTRTGQLSEVGGTTRVFHRLEPGQRFEAQLSAVSGALPAGAVFLTMMGVAR